MLVAVSLTGYTTTPWVVAWSSDPQWHITTQSRTAYRIVRRFCLCYCTSYTPCLCRCTATGRSHSGCATAPSTSNILDNAPDPSPNSPLSAPCLSHLNLCVHASQVKHSLSFQLHTSPSIRPLPTPLSFPISHQLPGRLALL